PLLSLRRERSRRRPRYGRLWRPPGGGGRPRQHRRGAVPPGEEPGDRAPADRQFPQMAAMSGRAGPPETGVEEATRFHGTDLADLCDASEAAIAEGGGFGWIKAPPRHILESYWKGVLLVP